MKQLRRTRAGGNIRNTSATELQQVRHRSHLPAPSRWLDISVPLQSGMAHWPGDPPVRIERVRDLERGDDSNVSMLSMGSHTGTHMDAPLHFLHSGRSLDEMPLDATLGPARVIKIVDAKTITVEELRSHRIQRGERLLFKTRNSGRCWKAYSFVRDFIHLSLGAAMFLAERRVKVVGVDYLSVGGYEGKDGVAIHQALLGAGIWIIEGLDLSQVVPGRYELLCLPLRIHRSDGAPARALLRPLPLAGRKRGEKQ